MRLAYLKTDVTPSEFVLLFFYFFRFDSFFDKFFKIKISSIRAASNHCLDNSGGKMSMIWT